jgi:hypothetical protein
MSIADFLCYIREQLIEARSNPNNQEIMTKLFYALTVLDEATLSSGDATYTSIIEEFINAIQHTSLAEFKVHIPSEDDIRGLA